MLHESEYQDLLQRLKQKRSRRGNNDSMSRLPSVTRLHLTQHDAEFTEFEVPGAGCLVGSVLLFCSCAPPVLLVPAQSSVSVLVRCPTSVGQTADRVQLRALCSSRIQQQLTGNSHAEGLLQTQLWEEKGKHLVYLDAT